MQATNKIRKHYPNWLDTTWFLKGQIASDAVIIIRFLNAFPGLYKTISNHCWAFIFQAVSQCTLHDLYIKKGICILVLFVKLRHIINYHVLHDFAHSFLIDGQIILFCNAQSTCFVTFSQLQVASGESTLQINIKCNYIKM